MHFGPKRTVGISGHYSEAQSGSMRKSSGDAEAVEVSGRQAEGPEDVRKLVEDQEGVGRGQEGPEEVGKAVGEGGRSGRTWESNGTLHLHGVLWLVDVRSIQCDPSKMVQD